MCVAIFNAITRPHERSLADVFCSLDVLAYGTQGQNKHILHIGPTTVASVQVQSFKTVLNPSISECNNLRYENNLGLISTHTSNYIQLDTIETHQQHCTVKRGNTLQSAPQHAAPMLLVNGPLTTTVSRTLDYKTLWPDSQVQSECYNNAHCSAE